MTGSLIRGRDNRAISQPILKKRSSLTLESLLRTDALRRIIDRY